MSAQQAPPTEVRVPVFSSVEEEAEYWDRHDTGEFENEFEPVELKATGPLAHSWEVAARLDEPTFRRIQAIAQARGLSLSALTHDWLLEALERSERHGLTSESNKR